MPAGIQSQAAGPEAYTLKHGVVLTSNPSTARPSSGGLCEGALNDYVAEESLIHKDLAFRTSNKNGKVSFMRCMSEIFCKACIFFFTMFMREKKNEAQGDTGKERGYLGLWLQLEHENASV